MNKHAASLSLLIALAASACMTGSTHSGGNQRGKDSEIFSEQGKFTWNPEGDTITLAGRESARYLVGEHQLTRLALDGSRITGPLSENYVMTKIPPGVTARYWQLVELNGRPISASKREPYLVLERDPPRVNGFGGCNSFTGTYEFDEAASRIRFGEIASTMMACVSGGEVEKEFHAMLRTVDNYSLNGDHLTLAREGAKVVVADIREDACAEVAALLRASGAAASSYRLGVGEEDEWRAVIQHTSPTTCTYTASKGTVRLLTKSAALHCAKAAIAFG